MDAMNSLVEHTARAATEMVESAGARMSTESVSKDSSSTLSLTGEANSQITVKGQVNKDSITAALKEKHGKEPSPDLVQKYITTAKELQRKSLEAAARVSKQFANPILPFASADTNQRLGAAVQDLARQATTTAQKAVAA
jgi:hypothetical protein